MSFVQDAQCRQLCRSRFTEFRKTDAFVVDERCGNVKLGPYNTRSAAQRAADQLNQYIAQNGCKPAFKVYIPG